MAQNTILIESRSLWPCSQKRTVHPVEHDRRYFTPATFRDDAHTPDRSRNWFPSNNYSLPGKQALSRDVGLATKLLRRVSATACCPSPPSLLRIAPFFPLFFRSLINNRFSRLPLNRSYLFIVYSHRCSSNVCTFIYFFLSFFLDLTESFDGGWWLE